MTSFNDFGLSDALNQSLAFMKYENPTPIQAEAIPLALAGRDIMGSAQTGTGKTAAYSIPLVEHLLRNPTSTALVLTPTRELGKQVMDIIRQLLGPKSPVKTAFLIGGEPITKQFAQLRNRPRLIVGTPGRINDHLRQGTLDLDRTGFLVLDETDRMLDMGFSVQINDILKYVPEERQTLMFSATLPPNIIKLSAEYLNNPERVSVGSTSTPVDRIKQEVLHINDERKYDELTSQLDKREGSVIIFVKTKYGTEKLAKRLNNDEHNAVEIHGDLKQNRREQVIRKFRAKEYRILVATDVVARGLDIPHIEHVINYDLPQVPEDYIHRIGRTARAGAEGSALCFVSPSDRRKWADIQHLIDPTQKSGDQLGGGKSGGKKFGGKPFGRKSYGGSEGGGRYAKKDGGRSFNRDGDRPRDGEAKPFRKPFAKDGERRFDRDGDRPARKPFNRDGEAKPFRSDRGDKPFRKEYRPEMEGMEGAREDKPFRKPFAKDGERRFDRDGDRPARKPFSRDGENRTRDGEAKPFRKPFAKDGERRFDRDGDRPARKPFSRDGENRTRDGEAKPFRKPFAKDGERRFDRDGDRPARKPFSRDGEKRFSSDRGDKPAGRFSKDGAKPFAKSGNKDGGKKFGKDFSRDGAKKTGGKQSFSKGGSKPFAAKKSRSA